MTAKRKFKSAAFEAIHSAAEGMYAAGTIDKETLKTFDETCLSVPAAPAVPMPPYTAPSSLSARGPAPHAYQNASPTTSAAVSAPVSASAAPVVSA